MTIGNLCNVCEVVKYALCTELTISLSTIVLDDMGKNYLWMYAGIWILVVGENFN